MQIRPRVKGKVPMNMGTAGVLDTTGVSTVFSTVFFLCEKYAFGIGSGLVRAKMGCEEKVSSVSLSVSLILSSRAASLSVSLALLFRVFNAALVLWSCRI